MPEIPKTKKQGKKQFYQTLLDNCNHSQWQTLSQSHSQSLSQSQSQSQSYSENSEVLSNHCFVKPVLAASSKRGRYVKAAAVDNISSDVSLDALYIPAGTTVIRETPSAFTLLKDYLDSLCIACLSPLPLQEQQQQQQNNNDTSNLDESSNHVSEFFSPAPTKRGIVCKGCIKQTYYCSTACQTRDAPRHGLECKVLRDLPGITASHGADYSLFRLVLAVIVRKYLEDENGRSVWEGSSLGLMNPTPYECVRDMISNRKYCSKEWLDAITKCGNYHIFQNHIPCL